MTYSTVSIGFYAIGLGVPPGALLWAAVLGVGAAVASGAGLVEADSGSPALVAALAVGVLGRLVARRLEVPATLRVVPEILPLLP